MPSISDGDDDSDDLFSSDVHFKTQNHATHTNRRPPVASYGLSSSSSDDAADSDELKLSALLAASLTNGIIRTHTSSRVNQWDKSGSGSSGDESVVYERVGGDGGHTIGRFHSGRILPRAGHYRNRSSAAAKTDGRDRNNFPAGASVRASLLISPPPLMQ